MPYKFVPDSFHTGVTAEALRAKIRQTEFSSLDRVCYSAPIYVRHNSTLVHSGTERAILRVTCEPQQCRLDSALTRKNLLGTP